MSAVWGRLRQQLMTYRGRELVGLARRAGLSKAALYRLRSDEHANVRFDTLLRLEHALKEKREDTSGL